MPPGPTVNVQFPRQTDDYGKMLFAKSRAADRAVVERVMEVANRRELPAAQLALAWVLHQPVVTAPIIGATKPHHLDDAVSALGVKLSAEETAYLEEPYVPHAIVGFE